MINRELQKELLEKMKDHYPKKANFICRELRHFTSYKSLKFNLTYLQEHELIENSWTDVDAGAVVYGGDDRELSYPLSGKITHRGIDFLENDGGLSAILGVVTVRLHSETIQEIETKILASDQPEAEKSRLLDRLRNMPEEGLKTLTQELVRTGLNQSTGMWETVLRALSG